MFITNFLLMIHIFSVYTYGVYLNEVKFKKNILSYKITTFIMVAYFNLLTLLILLNNMYI